MKALTVRQPWAWAIIHGGKDVENRTQAWSYRGPLAIHAGAQISDRGVRSNLIANAQMRYMGSVPGQITDVRIDTSAIIGVVDLVEIHVAQKGHACFCSHPPADPDPSAHASGCPFDPGCCESPWGETQYVEAGGKTRRQLVHLVLENPRPLSVPVPCTGRLGLWDLPADVLEEVSRG